MSAAPSQPQAQPQEPRVPQPAKATVRPPLLDSRELLQGHRTVEIQHNGELYRLQATRSGKLILTK